MDMIMTVAREMLYHDESKHRIKVCVTLNEDNIAADAEPLITKIRHGVVPLQGITCVTDSDCASYATDVRIRLLRQEVLNFGLVDCPGNRRMLREFATRQHKGGRA